MAKLFVLWDDAKRKWYAEGVVSGLSREVFTVTDETYYVDITVFTLSTSTVVSKNGRELINNIDYSISGQRITFIKKLIGSAEFPVYIVAKKLDLVSNLERQRFDVVTDNVKNFTVSQFNINNLGDFYEVYVNGLLKIETVDYTRSENTITITKGVFGTTAEPSYVMIKKYS